MTTSIIIFGGSRGIGKLLTTHFLDKGWQVTAAARTAASLQALKQNLPAAITLNVEAADVADETGVRRVFDAHQRAFGAGPAAVINTAAIQGPIGRSWTVSSPDWQETVRINLFGAFVITRCAVSSMMPGGVGSIIHFSGGGAAFGRPNFSAYAASKAGLLRLVETVAGELHEAGYPGITINAIAPGGVKTEMTAEILRRADQAGARETMAAEEVVRSGGTAPGLITALVDFLCDRDASRGISGHLLHVKDDYVKFVRDRGVLELPEDAGKLRRVPLS